MTFREFIIEADGGSRGNPGPSGSGAVIIDAQTGEIVVEIAKFGGVATNNVAEYKAVLAGLVEVFKLDPQARIQVRMDSKLVVEQMSGNWKIKHQDMQALAIEVQTLIAGKKVSWQWIPREQNSRADALANKAMDEVADSIVHLGSEERQSSKTVEFNPTKPSSIRAPGVADKALTTFILVRHGRTPLTEAHKISGGTGEDPGLSDLGREDAGAVAKLLSTLGVNGTFSHIPRPDFIVSSPMNRTKETAAAIAKVFDLPVTTEEGLREISFGDWDGCTNEEVATNWPELFKSWRGSWEVSPPNGESLAVFDKRIREVRAKLLQQYEGKCVVIVAHVMPIRGFLTLSLDAGISGYWRPQVAPCSVTVIRQWGEDFAELVTANFTAHL
jgi:probable phosphoglycerate mutase